MPQHSSRSSDPLHDLSSWMPVISDPKRSWREGCLRLTCSSMDPSLESPTLDVESNEMAVLLLRMRASRSKRSSPTDRALASLYYASKERPEFCEERSVHFEVALDRGMRDYIVSLDLRTEPGERIARLRFDPLDQPGECDVEMFSLRSIDCLRARDRDLETEDRLSNDRSLRLQLLHGSGVCMGYPEPFWILDGLGRWEKGLPAPLDYWEEVLPRVRRVGMLATSALLMEEPGRLERMIQAFHEKGCLLDLWTDIHLLRDKSVQDLAIILDRLVLMLDGDTFSERRESTASLEFLRSRDNLRGHAPQVVIGRRKLCRDPKHLLPFLRWVDSLPGFESALPCVEEESGRESECSCGRSDGEGTRRLLLEPKYFPSLPEGRESDASSPCWCEIPWTRTFLGPDGQLHVCWLYKGVICLNRAKETTSLFEMWNHELYRQVRRSMAFATNKGFSKPPVCAECSARRNA